MYIYYTLSIYSPQPRKPCIYSRWTGFLLFFLFIPFFSPFFVPYSFFYSLLRRFCPFFFCILPRIMLLVGTFLGTVEATMMWYRDMDTPPSNTHSSVVGRGQTRRQHAPNPLCTLLYSYCIRNPPAWVCCPNAAAWVDGVICFVAETVFIAF